MIFAETNKKPAAAPAIVDANGRTLLGSAPNNESASFALVEGPPPVTLWPGASLKHLGTTEDEKNNIWRVVWSDTVYYMFRARHDEKYRWLPAYKGTHAYVLERWLTPWQYSKTSREKWEIDNLTMGDLGPYPEKGTYFGPCWIFDGYPTLGAIESIVQLIVQGDQFSEWEKALAIVQAQEKEDALALNSAKEIIMESLPTNVTKGTFLPSAMKRAEDIPEKYSYQDIQKMKGLPMGDNKFFTTGAKRV